ncbi:S-layer homology domain-containing protein [Paenibacillus soyae]|uniref:Ig-like domain-containing protein n=1 Tax=Paenibacillus soyae TaxID=2969249 RepID=A0A9X2MWH8_9BACL|nr:Ig-like domain-containing protein [Paenibacillus soyae]MCR2807168.1 Ig-like domain-containing protein [Paenibacillus soyae]
MKKLPVLIAVTTLTSMLLSSPQQMPILDYAHAAGPAIIYPSQDGFWDEQGSQMDMEENWLGPSAMGYGIQRSAVQFQLPGTGTVTSAKLRLYITNISDNTMDSSRTPEISVYGSETDDWGVAFPAHGSQPISTNGAISSSSWVEFDVTDFVKLQMDPNKNNLVTFALMSNEADEIEILYAADNYADSIFHPQLVLEMGSEPAGIPSVTAASTAEDTGTTNGLVITPNGADTVPVTNYKISGITGGRLYKNDGVTEIADNSFITKAEGEAGLKFVPHANANSETDGPFTFKVQAAQDAAGTGLSAEAAAAIQVSEVNDAPTANVDVLTAIAENSGDRIIPFAALTANDNAGPANEGQQSLIIASVSNPAGGTVRIEGTNVIFTPGLDYRGAAGFDYTLQDNGVTAGTADPSTSGTSVSFQIEGTAGAPTVTDAETAEDTQTSNGLVIERHSEDGAEVTHYKITGITGGTLYQNDGTTRINEGSFITVSEGLSGLKFTPDPNANGTVGFGFLVQASKDALGSGLGAAAQASIMVSEVNDYPTAADDTLSAIQEDSGERIIPFEALLGNDSPGPANESGQSLTVTSVKEPVGGAVRIEGTDAIFTPNSNFSGQASFKYTIADNGTTNGSADPLDYDGMVEFDVGPVADQPSVSGASTAEDTQTTSGLVISKNATDGMEVTHYKITGITGGTLYKNDGTTRIDNGDFITSSEGGAGLKFTPDPNANTPALDDFGFDVQAALSATGEGLSLTARALITVSEVNDAPVANVDTLADVEAGSDKVTIPYADLIANDSTGALNEQQQSLTVISVDSPIGGTVQLVNGQVEFVPDDNYIGAAGFTYTVIDDGTTNGNADAKSSSADVQFDIVDSTPPSITLNGEQTIYLLVGEVYVEPGRSAYDELDKDLTDDIVVTGSVNTAVLGTYQLKYNVSDSSNNAAPEVTRTVRVVSADLAALSTGEGEPSPTFTSGQRSYTMAVENGVGQLNITAAKLDPTASVTINGRISPTGRETVNLNSGVNTITIVVTADGGSTQTYTITATRQAAASSGNTPQTSVRQAQVVTGDANQNVVKVDIARSVNGQGKSVDSVAMSGTKADEVIATAEAGNQKLARIIIDDLPGDPADEVSVKVSSDALSKLKEADLNLVIEASGARITLSAETLDRIGEAGEDLFFHIVPVRQAADQQGVTQGVMHASELQQYAKGKAVQVVGQPMMIETNYTNRKTNVMFPLTGIRIPTDTEERSAFLSELAIFVQHHDGTKDVEKGHLVFDAEGHPIGYEIEIETFSTFSFITVEGDGTYMHYMKGNPDGTFRPDAEMTRAELAATMWRLVSLDSAAVDTVPFPDVSASHWASEAIRELSEAGIFLGDNKGKFLPSEFVTRAEMAALIARVKGLETTNLAISQELTGHWAATAVAAVQDAGLMVGFQDGTFRPEETLTRAEAVTVLNRLFQRPLLSDMEQTWPDVSAEHWAYADIESATYDLRKNADDTVEKISKNESNDIK